MTTDSSSRINAYVETHALLKVLEGEPDEAEALLRNSTPTELLELHTALAALSSIVVRQHDRRYIEAGRKPPC
jgi:hypothetical protein